MQVFNARRRVGEEVVVGGNEACEPQTDGIEAFVVMVASGLEVAARHNSCGDSVQMRGYNWGCCGSGEGFRLSKQARRGRWFV